MEISNNKIISNTQLDVIDLTENIKNRIYSFHLILLKKNSKQILEFINSISSLIIIEGEVNLSNNLNNIKLELKLEEGVHVIKGSSFQISSNNDSKILVASTDRAPFKLNKNLTNNFNYEKFSSYHVDKPWGWEKWYTKNIENSADYALKMIYMNAGNQSSLQSHKDKSETNYVISGEANVLYGLQAPQDRSSVINLNDLNEKVYNAYSGWSNKVNELHRVIAKKTYKAIEVSTTELDDVVRWEDDSSRPDGKIAEEHTKK